MTDLKEKLRSLSFPRKSGQAERKPVINEDDGTVGGYQTIRWDGSQDAEIIPKPINVKARKGEEA